MKKEKYRMVKTLEEARLLIHELTVCTIFASPKSGLLSLWDHVDLPDKKKGEKGWGQKVGAVWTWKNKLPAMYPEEIFYGKVQGGFAVLMTMDHLRNVHFKAAYRNVDELNPLAVEMYDRIRNEPRETTDLRHEMVDDFGCTKSRFDTALKNLQITMNIVRSNDPDIERDTWMAFNELYPDIWNGNVPDA